MAGEPFNLYEEGRRGSIQGKYGKAGGNKSNCLSKKPQHAQSTEVRKINVERNMGAGSALTSLYLKAKVFRCNYGLGEEVPELLAFSLFLICSKTLQYNLIIIKIHNHDQNPSTDGA